MSNVTETVDLQTPPEPIVFTEAAADKVRDLLTCKRPLSRSFLQKRPPIKCVIS
jgi:hypothetical protein